MVNVADIDVVEPEVSGVEIENKDMLEVIFWRQKQLMDKYREIELANLPHVVPIRVPVDLDSHEGQDQVRQRIFWTIVELCEASDCMKNKAWKKTMMETDVPHLKEEMVDALHFFIEACILMGVSAEDLFELYMKKSRVNKFRQRTNY